MSILSNSNSLSSYKDKIKKLVLSPSTTTACSSNKLSETVLENVSKTFLIKTNRLERRNRHMRINKVFLNGTMKDLHEENQNFSPKEKTVNNKSNHLKMRNQILNYSRKLSCDCQRDVSNNKKPYINDVSESRRELVDFLSLSPTNYNKGLTKNKKNAIENYFSYARTNIKGIHLRDYKENLFFSPKWRDIKVNRLKDL